MKLRVRTILQPLVIALGCFLCLVACRVTPHADVGLDVDYYNGGFHVNPNASVGISGRPNRNRH